MKHVTNGGFEYGSEREVNEMGSFGPEQIEKEALVSLVIRLERTIGAQVAQLDELAAEFRRQHQQLGEAESSLDELASQIARLADFVLTDYDHEIGAGDPVHGESAVEVVIRMLSDLPKFEQVMRARTPMEKLLCTLLSAATTCQSYEGLHPEECWNTIVADSYSYGQPDPKILAEAEAMSGKPYVFDGRYVEAPNVQPERDSENEGPENPLLRNVQPS